MALETNEIYCELESKIKLEEAVLSEAIAISQSTESNPSKQENCSTSDIKLETEQHDEATLKLDIKEESVEDFEIILIPESQENLFNTSDSVEASNKNTTRHQEFETVFLSSNHEEFKQEYDIDNSDITDDSVQCLDSTISSRSIPVSLQENLICHMCDRTFESRDKFLSHNQNTCNKYIINLQCLYCNEVCKDSGQLDDHFSNIHFACKICNKLFTDSDELSMHVNEHNEGSIGFYQCSICNLKINTPDILNQHSSKIHSNERGCYWYKKVFIHPEVNSVTTQYPSCPYCNAKIQAVFLPKHLENKHRVVNCILCSYNFVRPMKSNTFTCSKCQNVNKPCDEFLFLSEVDAQLCKNITTLASSNKNRVSKLQQGQNDSNLSINQPSGSNVSINLDKIANTSKNVPIRTGDITILPSSNVNRVSKLQQGQNDPILSINQPSGSNVSINLDKIANNVSSKILPMQTGDIPALPSSNVNRVSKLQQGQSDPILSINQPSCSNVSINLDSKIANTSKNVPIQTGDITILPSSNVNRVSKLQQSQNDPILSINQPSCSDVNRNLDNKIANNVISKTVPIQTVDKRSVNYKCFKCEDCSQIFNNRMSLEEHCNQSGKNTGRKHYLHFPCLYCKLLCSDTNMLDEHIEKVHKICKICNVNLKTIEKLSEHKKQHMEGKILFYFCLCGKLFSNEIDSKIHLHNFGRYKHIHTIMSKQITDIKFKGIKPQCSYCNVVFNKTCALEMHLKRTHKVHYCNKCLKHFVRQTSQILEKDYCDTCMVLVRVMIENQDEQNDNMPKKNSDTSNLLKRKIQSTFEEAVMKVLKPSDNVDHELVNCNSDST